jgi:hypothetical protein
VSIRWFTSFACVLFTPVIAAAAAAKEAPSKQPVAAGKTPPGKSGQVFLITDYLKGTAEQIGEKVNAEPRRLLERKKVLQAKLEGREAGVVAGEGEALAQLRKSRAYRKAKADIARAERALAKARESGTAQQKVDASARYNRTRAALKKMEADATRSAAAKSKDGGGVDPKANVDELKADLARCEESLVKAATWRAHLIQAARNGLRIFAPIQEGTEGILGPVNVIDIRDNQSMVVSYSAPQEGKSLGVKEGVPAVEVTFHPTTIMVTGIDTTSLAPGASVTLDRKFKVTRVDDVAGRDPIYVVEPQPDDGTEELFARMKELDGQLPEVTVAEVEVTQEPDPADPAAPDQPAPAGK